MSRAATPVSPGHRFAQQPGVLGENAPRETPGIPGERFAPLLVAFLYFAVTALTRATFQGDTPYYVSSILTYSGGRDFAFWDFGHLLWRALNWLLFQAARGVFSGSDPHALLTSLMIGVNWLAGLGCALWMLRVARRFVSVPLAISAAAALMLSQAFLNYLHTGTAYVPGLFFLLLALDLASSQTPESLASWRCSAAFGFALALPVLLWLPFVFAIPGLLLFPLAIRGRDARSFDYLWKALVTCGAIGLLAYGAVALKLRLSSVAEIGIWFRAASHSIQAGGLPRAVFGFARSWLDMGNDAIQFRRFLLHDPYSHLPAAELLFTGLWKVALTYAFLAAIAWKLVRGRQEDLRMLAFLSISFLPVFAFGIKWQGGDMERYLAAFPALLLAAAFVFRIHPSPALKMFGIAFACALVVVNFSQYVFWVRNAQDRESAARVDVLASIPAGSYVGVFPGDPLIDLVASSSATLHGNAKSIVVGSVIPIGYCYADQWREVFASSSLKAWTAGKEVWISRGLLNPAPAEKDGWVDGAEPTARWPQVSGFFHQFQTSGVRGDFVEMPPSSANLNLLTLAAANPPTCH